MYSVLISVYIKEIPNYLDLALSSIFQQTLPPTEVILVKDGPLSDELEIVIDRYLSLHPTLKVLSLPTNVGLGSALNIGLKQCAYDYVARMDADDICVCDRFEIQLNFLARNVDVDVVGGYIEEFRIIPGDLGKIRKVPLLSHQIERFARRRNPLNHPTVMFRKDIVNHYEGYKRMLFFEDYYLWLRLIKGGAKIVNIDKVLLNFRVGNDMIGRRCGFSYLKKELAFYRTALKEGLLSYSDFIFCTFTRLPLRLLPKFVLHFLYTKVLR